MMEPDHADERGLARQLDRELGEAIDLQMIARRREVRVNCRPVGKRRKKLQHPGVGRHRGERRGILVAPFAQQQAWGSERESHC
jgi:hypothetical protein